MVLSCMYKTIETLIYFLVAFGVFFLSYSFISKSFYQIFQLSAAHSNLDCIFKLFKGQNQYPTRELLCGLAMEDCFVGWFFGRFLGGVVCLFILIISSCLLFMKKFLKLHGFFWLLFFAWKAQHFI